MHTGDALLQAIIDEPEDDSLRLIYADWLADHGQPERSELIRVEVEMFPRLVEGLEPEVADDPEYHRLGRIREALKIQHAATWFGPFAALSPQCGTERGFLSAATVSARLFANRADELFAAAPLLELVSLEQIGRNMPAVAARPELARLRGVSFCGKLGSAGLSAFCKSPHLAGLRWLSFYDTAIGPKGASALADTPSLAGLRDLILMDRSIGPGGAAAIVGARHFAGLEEMMLSFSSVGDPFAEALARADHITNLRILRLDYTDLTPAGITALARAPHLASLRRLDLDGNDIGPGLPALAGSPYLRYLESLNLGQMHASDADLAVLLRSPILHSLRKLSVCNQLGLDSTLALADGEPLPELRTLVIKYSNQRDALAEHLGATRRFPALRCLEFRGNFFARKHVRALAAGPLLAGLTRLHFQNCALKDVEIKTLANLPALANLRGLGLYDNEIFDDGALALARSRYLNNLVHLDLRRNEISTQALQVLRHRFGDAVCVRNSPGCRE
jgi:uncharacterized protein (TIGR02996 family)